jgi:hypothetical protein
VGLFTRLNKRMGALPEPLRAEGQAEGVVLIEEGVVGHVTYRHYRAPRHRYGYARKGTGFALVLTQKRLLVVTGRYRHIDVPWAAPQMAALVFSAEDGALKIAYDAAKFHPDRSGSVEIVLYCAQPEQVLEQIRSRNRA